jgi:hypothetical protein
VDEFPRFELDTSITPKQRALLGLSGLGRGLSNVFGRGASGPSPGERLRAQRNLEAQQRFQEALARRREGRQDAAEDTRKGEREQDRQDRLNREVARRKSETDALVREGMANQEDILAGLHAFEIDPSQFDLGNSDDRARAKGMVLRAQADEKNRSGSKKSLTPGQIARIEDAESIFLDMIEELETAFTPESIQKEEDPKSIRRDFLRKLRRRLGRDPERLAAVAEEFEIAVGALIDDELDRRGQAEATAAEQKRLTDERARQGETLREQMLGFSPSLIPPTPDQEAIERRRKLTEERIRRGQFGLTQFSYGTS